MEVGFLFETFVLLNMELNQSLPTYYVYPSALNGAILWASSYRYSIYNTERGVVVIEINTYYKYACPAVFPTIPTICNLICQQLFILFCRKSCCNCIILLYIVGIGSV